MLDDRLLFEKLKRMPEPLRAEALQYIETLIQRYEASKGPRKRPRFGSASGYYRTTDDFDAPLDDFRDYME